jgi:hypothetical protein
MEHYGIVTGKRKPKYPTWSTVGFKLGVSGEKLTVDYLAMT